ncbi:MAG: DUF2460 domain-containing protein [Bryobacterales bacterium]|nr:DUF2460 domain-containing protein [Bryobacterales bacterium]
MTFPKLKTGAVMQYPAARQHVFSNHLVQFVDGREQRYRNSEGQLHRWRIALEMLDPGELAAIEAFFVAQQGRYGDFPFTDPASGTEYPSCSLAEDQWSVDLKSETKGTTTLIIRENRS